MDKEKLELVTKAKELLRLKGIEDDKIYDLFAIMLKEGLSLEQAEEQLEQDLEIARDKIAYNNYKTLIKTKYLGVE